jgi:hypothetical protein
MEQISFALGTVHSIELKFLLFMLMTNLMKLKEG